MFSNFFYSKIAPFMRQCVKNIVESDRPQRTIWRMRIACCIPKATNTHTQRICNIYYISAVTAVARMCLNVTIYVHCISGCYSSCGRGMFFKPVICFCLFRSLGHRDTHKINPLNRKHRLLYLKTQFVPRSKHFPSRL